MASPSVSPLPAHGDDGAISCLDAPLPFRSSSLDIATPSMLWPATPTPHHSTTADGCYSFNVPVHARRTAVTATPTASVQGLPVVVTPAPSARATAGTSAAGLPLELREEESVRYCRIDAAGLHGWSSTIGMSPPQCLDSVGVGVGGLPSVGSALHGTGRCSPCAWSWKAKGCKAAAACNFCHLCPEDELKNRKKAKIAALRSVSHPRRTR